MVTKCLKGIFSFMNRGTLCLYYAIGRRVLKKQAVCLDADDLSDL
jgi:hypothetical protein